MCPRQNLAFEPPAGEGRDLPLDEHPVEGAVREPPDLLLGSGHCAGVAQQGSEAVVADARPVVELRGEARALEPVVHPHPG